MSTLVPINSAGTIKYHIAVQSDLCTQNGMLSPAQQVQTVQVCTPPGQKDTSIPLHPQTV